MIGKSVCPIGARLWTVAAPVGQLVDYQLHFPSPFRLPPRHLMQLVRSHHLDACMSPGDPITATVSRAALGLVAGDQSKIWPQA
jgi:hypothetical protein